MKKLILFFVLILSTTGIALCQKIKCDFCIPNRPSKTYLNFNSTFVNHRHIVSLPKNEKIIIELASPEDYDLLRNIDGLLVDFRNEMTSFQDSLQTEPSGSVRVDYAYNTNESLKKIRIQKYNSNGDIFIDKDGEIAHLKVEQDTIHMMIGKMVQGMFGRKDLKFNRPVQLTLILNNLNDLDSLISNHTQLQQYIDTMASVSASKMKKNDPFYHTTIIFNPYRPESKGNFGKRFLFFEGAVSDDHANFYALSHPNTVGVVVDMGAGLVRNTISPMAEAGIEFRLSKRRMIDYISFVRLSTSCYFLFDRKPEGTFTTYDNWFVNAEYGTIEVDKENSYPLKKMTAGLGYLFRSNSTYFQNTTMKAFLNFPLNNQFIIAPEVIATNNLITFFPGVTFKGFLFRD